MTIVVVVAAVAVAVAAAAVVVKVVVVKLSNYVNYSELAECKHNYMQVNYRCLNET